MGLDSMRGTGRCPPFLVGGLLVISVILAFNWWSVSTQNYVLIKQLERLEDQLKKCATEQEVCSHQRGSAETRIKNLDGEIATLRVHEEQSRADNEESKKSVSDLNDQLKDLTKEREELHSSSVLCKTELESLKKLDISKDGTIATLRLEKERFGTQLDERKQEVQKLRLEMEHLSTQLKAEQSRTRGAMMIIPTPKNAPSYFPRNGDLNVVDRNHISVHSIGMKGIKPQREQILPQDSRYAVRPKPMFSVTNIKAASSAAAGRVENNGMLVGENHENVQAQDVDKAENEAENNAGERGDDTNPDNEPQVEEAERMEEANEGVLEEAPKKNSIDVIAHRI